MLIFTKEKIVLLTPPKTASTALHRELSLPVYKTLAVVGESMFPGNVDKHTCRIPNEARGCTVLATVRHPLDRLVSLYCHYTREESEYNGRYSMAFWDFANRACREHEPVTGHDIDALYKRTISDHLEGIDVHGYIRFESLAEDLALYGIQCGQLDRLNASFRRPWIDYYDEPTMLLARKWSEKDMTLGNYT